MQCIVTWLEMLQRVVLLFVNCTNRITKTSRRSGVRYLSLIHFISDTLCLRINFVPIKCLHFMLFVFLPTQGVSICSEQWSCSIILPRRVFRNQASILCWFLNSQTSHRRPTSTCSREKMWRIWPEERCVTPNAQLPTAQVRIGVSRPKNLSKPVKPTKKVRKQ